MPIDDQSLKNIHRELALYVRRMDQIRADPNLSERGKQQQLADLYTEQKMFVAHTVEAAEQTYRATRFNLEKKIFGSLAPATGMDMVAKRDALDRADAIESPAEARALLRRCQLHGDTVLAQAILTRSWQESAGNLSGTGWGSVAQEYIDNHRPDLRAAADEYAQIVKVDNKITRAEQAMSVSVTKPRELTGISDVDIQRLAGEMPAPPPEETAAVLGHTDLPSQEPVTSDR